MLMKVKAYYIYSTNLQMMNLPQNTIEHERPYIFRPLIWVSKKITKKHITNYCQSA